MKQICVLAEDMKGIIERLCKLFGFCLDARHLCSPLFLLIPYLHFGQFFYPFLSQMVICKSGDCPDLSAILTNKPAIDNPFNPPFGKGGFAWSRKQKGPINETGLV